MVPLITLLKSLRWHVALESVSTKASNSSSREDFAGVQNFETVLDACAVDETLRGPLLAGAIDVLSIFPRPTAVFPNFLPDATVSCCNDVAARRQFHAMELVLYKVRAIICLEVLCLGKWLLTLRFFVSRPGGVEEINIQSVSQRRSDTYGTVRMDAGERQSGPALGVRLIFLTQVAELALPP